MENRFTRYALPLLIIFFSLPSAAMGILNAIALAVSPFVHAKGTDNPLLPLVVLEYMCSLIMALCFEPFPLVVAGALWVLLLVIGKHLDAKICTGVILAAAVYGIYVLESEFVMH
jgi:hypothetical protein